MDFLFFFINFHQVHRQKYIETEMRVWDKLAVVDEILLFRKSKRIMYRLV